jgi:hypothetical protein
MNRVTQRSWRDIAAVSVLTWCAVLLLGVSIASAEKVHPLITTQSVPNLTRPQGVAVDQTTHAFYVGGFLGTSNPVYKYTASGQLDPTTPELTGASGLNLYYVAVDNSGGPFSGYVYATDVLAGVIQQYDPSGAATSVVISAGALPPNGTPQAGGLPPVVNNGEPMTPSAVAVGPEGNIFVVDARGEKPARAIEVFSSTGAFVKQLAAGSVLGQTSGIGIDNSGRIYLSVEQTGSGPGLQQGVTALEPDGTCVALGCAPLTTIPSFGLGVDRTAERLFVTTVIGGKSSFKEFSFTGTELSSSDTEVLHLGFGIDIDETSGNIVVGDNLPAAEATVKVFGPTVIVPDSETGVATAVTDNSASVAGVIGADGVAGATCVFQFVPEQRFQLKAFEGAPTAPCVPAGPFAGSGHEPVHADLAGLTGGTTYHYRLLATNTNGSNPGATETFTTLGPSVSGESVSGVTQTGARLQGEINPNGAESSYRFQYVDQSSFEASVAEGNDGFTAAVEVPSGGRSIGSGNGAIAVAEQIGGLVNGRVYHFRLVAANVDGTTFGGGGTFKAQEGGPTGLADGRGYEQASPVDKNGADIQGEFNAVQAGPSGNGITFYSSAGLPGGEGAQNFPSFLATRASDGSGWSSQGLLPSAAAGWRARIVGWTEDLSETFSFTLSPNSPVRLVSRSSAGGALTEVGSVNSTEIPYAYAGSAAGNSIAVFESTVGGLVPGDLAGKQNVYVWDKGNQALHLASVLNDGTVPTQGAMAGPYDWFVQKSLTGIGGAAKRYFTQNEHVISGDGSRLFFTAAGTGQIYVRIHPLATQSPVDGSGKCLDPSLACTIRISAPETGVVDPNRPAAFVGASSDGSLAYFMSSGKLTADATGGGNDLYRYDLQSGDLTDLTVDQTDKGGAQVEGVLQISPDGQTVYFVAAGALTGSASPASSGETNLYVSNGGTVSFIARLQSAQAEELNWLPASQLVSGFVVTNTSRISADGATLLLRSNQQLTGYDNQGVYELYLYRLGGGIKCLSCNPSNEPPKGPAGVQEIPKSAAAPKLQSAITTRNLSADGQRVIFDSPDRLTAGDTNDAYDVYEWEAKGKGSCTSDSQNGGCLFLISSGTSNLPSYFADADPEGTNVFFFTAQGLVAQDRDQLVDVYDARIGGGLASQNAVPPAPCVGEESCRGAAAPPPALQSPGSAAFVGPGNAKAPKKCKKGFVRKHGKCVKKKSGKKTGGKKKHHQKSQHKSKGKKNSGKGAAR